MCNIIRKLSRASSSKSLRSNDSSASSSDNSAYTSITQNIVNSQEINITQIENQLHNWSIPHLKINTRYQQENFEFNQNYSIKIEEKTISLNQNLESLLLISQNTINHHINLNHLTNKSYYYYYYYYYYLFVRKLDELIFKFPYNCGYLDFKLWV